MKYRVRSRSMLAVGVVGLLICTGIGAAAFIGMFADAPDTVTASSPPGSGATGSGGGLISQANAFTIPSTQAIDTPVAPEPAAPALRTRAIKVKRGDTLMKLLVRNDIDRGQAHAAITALSEVYDLRRMQIGQMFELSLKPEDGESGGHELVGLSFKAAPVRNIQVSLTDGKGFRAEIEEQALTRADGFGAGTIRSSLYEAAVEAGIPAAVLHDLIRMFSFDVDFQRDIQPGDRFEILYDEHMTADGTLVRTGDITYAAMTLSGKHFAYYRYTPESGVTDYFNEKGRSVRKTLMRTPINGARLSSAYGKRKHPILGYTKMHRGTDFAAPTGTPIMAAGDGVVDYIGTRGAYGKYIRIRHNSTYKTAYAHMSRYKKGLKRGDRVKQGETIGYVGSTGRSTGPHLHYEVLENGKQRNPMSVKIPAGERLDAKELARFAATLPAMQQRIAFARDGGRFLARD